MPYRFEVASSNRAGCTNKECKDAKLKISKGELRVGTWVENERFQSYQWRHWGCVTPKVLENIKNAWEEQRANDTDYDCLDGYDELPEIYQDKLRKALEQGHVDDEDWKGDLECNRPGARNFRVPASRKKKESDDADKDDSAKSPEKDDKAKNAKTGKAKANEKKPRVAKVGTTDGTDEKESAQKGKKASNKEDASGDAPAGAISQPKRPARAKKYADEDDLTKQANKGTKRKAAEDGEEKPKRRGRAAKSQAENGDVDSTPEKPKRTRKKSTEAS